MQTEGLMAEVTLSSCYDFVEQCCDLVYKQLSLMQKQSECPAESKAAVSSLMFAAARVSDLPELRELRETFQEKYGNSLQYSVNQKFVEDLSSPPPTMEKKIQLMRDIAAEYSISWNYWAFEKQMCKPPVHVQEQPSSQRSVTVKDNFRTGGGNSVDEKDKNVILSKVRYERTPDQYGSRVKNGDGRGGEINMKTLGRHDNGRMSHEGGDDNATRRANDDSLYLKGKEAHTVPASLLVRSPYGREQNGIQREHELLDKREVSLPKREVHQTLSLGRQVTHTHKEILKVPGDSRDISATIPDAVNSQDADKLKAKSFNKTIPPPPYVKPPKAPKAEDDSDLKYSGFNGNDADKSSRDVANQPTSGYSNRSDKARYGSSSNRTKYEKETSEPRKGKEDESADKQIGQNDSTGDLPLPKPKSVRRRNSSRSSSSHEDVIGNLEDTNMEKRSSSSKRSDTKRGLQILFDDGTSKKDDEKVLDKLLIHLSTKPTYFDAEKLRRRSEGPHQIPPEASRRNVESKVKPGNVSPLAPSHSRSVSLPHEQSVPPKPAAKVFARAASFQPDRPAKHVHPNLPNCDDLAARLAAIRGSC
uniref:Uncharacterized protein n=1 Tax=Kalanchoe fedtschenkoi TaxID=63787 RepID=A0A7N0T7Z1_KALFE